MELKKYHHGDLRAALLEAGLTLVASRQSDDLSLREVAAAVGVSATAVYRHFADKRAMMAALASEGWSRLGADQHQASEAAGGGVAGFNATGRAYVRFAVSNPALFRVMVAYPVGAHQTGDPATDAMAFLRANAEALAPPSVAARIFALQSWSLAHGLAMLMLDEQIEANDDLIDAVINAPKDASGGAGPTPGFAETKNRSEPT